jgi:hypothetical protein
VFTCEVVTEWVTPDELFADGELDVVTNDSDLHAFTGKPIAILTTYPVEQHVTGDYNYGHLSRTAIGDRGPRIEGDL